MLKLQPRHLLRVYELSQHLADAVVPQEYGETPADKFEVGIKTCHSLLGKIREDLRLAAEEGASIAEKADSATDDSRSVGDMSAMTSLDQEGGLVEGGGYRLDRRLAKSMGIKNANRHVRTRLYFTSESHLHAVMNVLRFAHVANPSLPKPLETGLKKISEAEEMSYLCHIVVRLYEVTEPNGQKHHILRVYVSDGISVRVVEMPAGNNGPNDVTVVVGTQPDKQPEQAKPATATVSLHSTGFGFSSFHQCIPLSPSVGSSSSGGARVSSRNATGHHIKMLPPANPMIPLWQQMSLSDGMKLFDPNLIELVAGAQRPTSADIPAASPAPPSASARSSRGFPMQRFDSNVHALFKPSWQTEDADEDE